jgi:hypothetical protein
MDYLSFEMPPDRSGCEHRGGKGEGQQGRLGWLALCSNGLDDDPCPTSQYRKQGNAHGPWCGFSKPAHNPAPHCKHSGWQGKRQHATDAAGQRACRDKGCGCADNPIGRRGCSLATASLLAWRLGIESLEKRLRSIAGPLRRFHDDSQRAMFFANFECQESAAGPPPVPSPILVDALRLHKAIRAEDHLGGSFQVPCGLSPRASLDET